MTSHLLEALRLPSFIIAAPDRWVRAGQPEVFAELVVSQRSGESLIMPRAHSNRRPPGTPERPAVAIRVGEAQSAVAELTA